MNLSPDTKPLLNDFDADQRAAIPDWPWYDVELCEKMGELMEQHTEQTYHDLHYWPAPEACGFLGVANGIKYFGVTVSDIIDTYCADSEWREEKAYIMDMRAELYA